MSKVDEALAQAKRLGFTVSPAITNQKPSTNQKTMQEKLEQLELENRLLKATSNSRGQRTSLVESNITGSSQHSTRQGHGVGRLNRNMLQERLSQLDMQSLASRETGIPENTTIEQLLRDFSALYLLRSGYYGED